MYKRKKGDIESEEEEHAQAHNARCEVKSGIGPSITELSTANVLYTKRGWHQQERYSP